MFLINKDIILLYLISILLLSALSTCLIAWAKDVFKEKFETLLISVCAQDEQISPSFHTSKYCHMPLLTFRARARVSQHMGMLIAPFYFVIVFGRRIYRLIDNVFFSFGFGNLRLWLANSVADQFFGSRNFEHAWLFGCLTPTELMYITTEISDAIQCFVRFSDSFAPARPLNRTGLLPFCFWYAAWISQDTTAYAVEKLDWGYSGFDCSGWFRLQHHPIRSWRGHPPPFSSCLQCGCSAKQSWSSSVFERWIWPQLNLLCPRQKRPQQNAANTKQWRWCRKPRSSNKLKVAGPKLKSHESSASVSKHSWITLKIKG